jgi:PKD repeat protein
MKAKRLLSLAGFIALFLLISCSKDEEKPKPVTSFTASKTAVLAGEEIQFTNTSENAASYAWSFGDGTTSTLESPTKTYNAVGTYTVTLVATGEGGSASATQDITVTAASVYFIDPTDEILGKLVLDVNQTVTTAKALTGMSGVGLAYDNINNKIFFSDYNDATTPDGKIWKMNFDGTSPVAIVSGLLDPYGIALDAAGGKIYWVDDAGNVSRANTDGTSPELGLVTITDGWLRAIALDKENNKMYFYDVNAENLYVANLDGTEPTILIPGVYGYLIYIDTVNDKIYFDDQNSGTDGKLRRSNLDGTGIVDIDDAATRIYGMDIDREANKLYWSARDLGEIYRANLDGTGKEILKTGLSSPRGMFLKK